MNTVKYSHDFFCRRLKIDRWTSYFVEVTEFPEEDKQFLVKLNLFGRVGQVCLRQRVCQQASQTFQDKVIILQAHQRTCDVKLLLILLAFFPHVHHSSQSVLSILQTIYIFMYVMGNTLQLFFLFCILNEYI